MTPTWIAALFVLLALLVGIVIGAMISGGRYVRIFTRITDDGSYLVQSHSLDGMNWYEWKRMKRVDPTVTGMKIQDGSR